MKVTFDRYRFFHLIILIACSCIFAEILISKLALARLSAYGFACSVVTGLSRAILEKSDSDRQAQNTMRRLQEEKMEKRRDRRKR
jgi:hypothetical protein